MNRKVLAGLMALVLAAACFSGCGSEGSDSSAEKSGTTEAETTTAAKATTTTNEDDAVNYNDGLKAPVSKEPINIAEDGFTSNMYSRALFNEGDTAKLASKIKEAKDIAADNDLDEDEKIKKATKIAFIGDSITAGSTAKEENQYVNVVTSWWDKNVSSYWTVKNAGVGATDSYLAVHRVDDDVLADSPDIIFIEFINDANTDFYKSTMDSLVRKCLASPNKPAVVMIEMTMQDGTCPQSAHYEIAERYDIPVISYHDAVIPEIEAGNFEWADISADNIHPNDVGHKLLGDLLVRYLSDTINNVEYLDLESVEDFDPESDSPTGDKYRNAKLLDCKEAEPKKNEGFANSEEPADFQDNLCCDNGGTVTFELEFKNLGMLYYMTTDGKSGIASVSVDGQVVNELNADFTGGWGDYAKNQELVSFDEKGKHEVTVTVPEGKRFGILRWMIS